jgi:syntaxin 1B/2/3
MDQLVVAQEPVIERTEHNAVQTQEDVGKGNQEVDKAIKHARNRNKLKWYCLLIVILIIVGIALGVGLGVGLNKAANN